MNVDFYNPNWSKDHYRLAKDMVDFGVGLVRQHIERYRELSGIYRAYHEKYTAKEKRKMANVHGHLSATEMVPYFKPKGKIDQLLGESLEVGFSAEVDTINPTEINKKKKKYLRQLGRSAAKPMIQEIQKQGFNIYNGVHIPDMNDPALQDPTSIRTRNEMISQRILNEKIKDVQEKNLYYNMFGSQIFASEIHTFLHRDRFNRMSLTHIPPERMIYIENESDPFLIDTPIIGFWQNMYFPQIVDWLKISRKSDEYAQLNRLFGSINGNGNYTDDRYMNLWSSEAAEGNEYEIINQPVMNDPSGLKATVYYFQWRYYKEVVIERLNDGSVRIVNMKESRERRRVERKDGEFHKTYFENIYQGASIAGNIYVGFRDIEDPVLIPDAEGNYRAMYDFTSSLNRTFGNHRTSFAKVLVELGREYNKARWMLMREAKKLRSNSIFFDHTFADKKSRNSWLYELEDLGVVNINSKEAFGEAPEDLQIMDGKRVVGALASGTSGTVIMDLINICNDLEQAIERSTGMNDARQGIEKATTTATTNTNNLQASRSVTFDNFYFTENHMQRTLSSLIQKTKVAISHGSREGYGYLGEDDLSYLEESPEYFLDDFKARIVGGRSSQIIINELNQIIANEAAAGKRSSLDYVRIRQQHSLQEIEDILEQADTRMQKIEQDNKMQQIQEQNQAKKEMNDRANQIREDEQANQQELQDKKDNTAIRVAEIQKSASQQLPPTSSPMEMLGEAMKSIDKSKQTKK